MRTDLGAWLSLTAVLLYGGACTPSLEEGKFACSDDVECPEGWLCRAARCWSTEPTDVDAGRDASIADAGSDAGPDAGPDADSDAGCEPTGLPLDLLVMVDDSGSMAAEQEALADAMPELVRVLATGDVEPDGVEDFTPVTDLHVGVVSSDMGIGGYSIENCTDPDGDDGVLLHEPSPDIAGCATVYPTFLTYGAGSGLSTFRMDFSCIATLGIDGCGLEQQLEAVLKALTPASSSVRFSGDTTGHGDGENAGFLRDDSLLVVLLVTDEDDCSTGTPDFFDPDSPTLTAPLNIRCGVHDDLLYPISRYVDGLRALRPGFPDKIVLGALVAVPLEVRDSSFEEILAHPQMVVEVDPADPRRLAHSCPDINGFPPRRIVEAAQELDLLGSGAVVGSLCDGDFSGMFARLLARIQDALAPYGTCE